MIKLNSPSSLHVQDVLLTAKGSTTWCFSCTTAGKFEAVLCPPLLGRDLAPLFSLGISETVLVINSRKTSWFWCLRSPLAVSVPLVCDSVAGRIPVYGLCCCPSEAKHSSQPRPGSLRERLQSLYHTAN